MVNEFMVKILTDSERIELLSAHKTERDGRVRDRLKAVLWYDAGWTLQKIAQALFMSDDAIGVWISDYTQTKKLAPNHKGSQPKLNDAQMTQICTHLEGTIYTKTKDIVAYVSKIFGIFYSVRGMTNWLHAHKFSYHKPCSVPAKADSAQQAAFLETYETLKRTRPDEDQIVFMDGVHPTHQVRPVCGWIRTGVRKDIPTNAGHKRLNIIGALNLETMSVYQKDYPTRGSEAIKDYFEYLQTAITGTGCIHVILDRARYQSCAEVRLYVQTSRIRLHFLPPYSPNLNSIEALWKIMHEETTQNTHYAHFKDFTEAIGRFFATFPEKSRQWTDRLTDNFRVLHAPLLPHPTAK
jgi:transposase